MRQAAPRRRRPITLVALAGFGRFLAGYWQVPCRLEADSRFSRAGFWQVFGRRRDGSGRFLAGCWQVKDSRHVLAMRVNRLNLREVFTTLVRLDQGQTEVLGMRRGHGVARGAPKGSLSKDCKTGMGFEAKVQGNRRDAASGLCILILCETTVKPVAPDCG